MTGSLFELAIVIIIATALGIAAKIFRQPIILAYLGTGMLIGYFGFLSVGDKELFAVFSDLGIMFLLFLVGLEINYTSLRLVGKASVIIGLGQIIFTAFFGYLIATMFGFSLIPALYIAVTLTFSSTIIIVKLLSDKRDTQSLYGKISIGFLLVQDLVAIILLVLLAGIGTNNDGMFWNIITTFIKAIGLFALMLFLGRKVFPIIFNKIARSQELLFLASLAWLFLLAAAVSKIGFSIEIAGFLAGIALANSSEHFEISYKLRPLRDFFILIFFVILGASIVFSNFSGLMLPIIVFSLFILIGNPLIVLIIMGIMGYRKRTSFLTGLTVAQISEFSLIVIAMGLKVGHVNESVVAIVTAVGLITIALSSYFIMYGEKLFNRLSKILSFFERKKNIEGSMDVGVTAKQIVLIGHHRMGESIAKGLPKDKLLVVEFDPEIIKKLKHTGYQILFGDITDSEIFNAAKVEEAKIVISTSPDFENNMHLIHMLKSRRLPNPPKVVVRAETNNEMLHLYDAGADYVLVPHFTAGQYFGKTLAIDPEMRVLSQLKARDLELASGILNK